MPDTIPCPACGTENPPDAIQCQVCDYELRAPLPAAPSGPRKCARCGSMVAQGAGFCQVCGQSADQRLPRPHTGALNVREMFGDQSDAPIRQPIRERTEIAPSAQPNPGPQAFQPPSQYSQAPQPAAAGSATDSGAAPRTRRRPAPRPRPNFDPNDSGVGAAQPQRAPVYADQPPRPSAPPRPQPGPAPSDPSASTSFGATPRPRSRAPAHAEPVAPYAQSGGSAQHQPQPQSQPRSHSQPTWAPPGAYTQPGGQMRLVLVGRDGQEGESFPIPGQGAEIGRHAAIAFPSDPFVSPRHAQLTLVPGGVNVVDLSSRNGVYARLSEPAPVYPGDYFLLGNQLLRLDQLDQPWQEKPPDSHDVRGFGTPVKPPWAALTRVCVGDIEDDRYHLRGNEMTIGREEGEIVFPSDGFLSRQHARLRMVVEGNAMTVLLEDLGSANGTYLRLRGPMVIPVGGMFRVGDQIFRVRSE